MTAGPATAGRAPGRALGAAGAVAVGGALLVVAHLWGSHLVRGGQHLLLGWPPFFGRLEPRVGARAVPAVAVAVAVLAFSPRLTRRLRWNPLLLAVALGGAGWAVALAWVDGWSGLTDPLRPAFEYLHDVPRVGSPGDFLRHFIDRIDSYAIQLQGHPPGLVLVLWLLDRLGLGGAGWAAGLMIGVGVTAAPAALFAVREVSGEAAARAAAPFLAVPPAAVWIATSGDAVFLGLGAWAVALLVRATRGDRASYVAALVGGVLGGLCLHMTYGAVLLAAVVVAVAWGRRTVRPLVVGSVGVAAVTVAFATAGFWWLEGLGATRRLYYAGIGGERPYGYFLLANLALFSVAVGPAALAGVARQRDRGTWLLVGGALAAVALADLSGLSKAEVERIWLLFVPWVMTATCSLPSDRWPLRGWLALQLLTGVVVQTMILSPW